MDFRAIETDQAATGRVLPADLGDAILQLDMASITRTMETMESCSLCGQSRKMPSRCSSALRAGRKQIIGNLEVLH